LVISALPVVIAVTIDGRFRGHVTDLELGAIVVTLAVIGWVLNWGRQWLTVGLVARIVRRLQIDATDAALAKDAAFFDRHSTGQVLSRVTGDTEGFASVLTLTLNFVSQLFLVILLTGLVFAIEPVLGAVIVAIVPLLVATTLLFRRIARTAAIRTRRVMARITANVHESMAGIGVTKGFGREETTYREFDHLNRLSYQVYLRQGLIYSMILPMLTLLAGLGTVATLYAGGRLSQQSRRSDASPRMAAGAAQCGGTRRGGAGAGPDADRANAEPTDRDGVGVRLAQRRDDLGHRAASYRRRRYQPQQRLNFAPEPQWQGSFRPGFGCMTTDGSEG